MEALYSLYVLVLHGLLSNIAPYGVVHFNGDYFIDVWCRMQYVEYILL